MSKPNFTQGMIPAKTNIYENPKEVYEHYLNIARTLMMQLVKASNGKALNEVFLRLQAKLMPHIGVYENQLENGWYNLTLLDMLTIIDKGEEMFDNVLLSYLYSTIIDYPIVVQNQSKGQWIIFKSAVA
jgi:hypothetical protein